MEVYQESVMQSHENVYQLKTHCVAKRMMIVLFYYGSCSMKPKLKYQELVQFHSNKFKNNKLMNGSDSDFLFLEYNSYHTIFIKNDLNLFCYKTGTRK